MTIITPKHPDGVYFKAVDMLGSEVLMDYYDTETREAHILPTAKDYSLYYITSEEGKEEAWRIKTILPKSIKVTISKPNEPVRVL